jgi:hypothetical protein
LVGRYIKIINVQITTYPGVIFFIVVNPLSE